MVYKKKKWKWKPGANTWIYLPLDGDVNDYSGNNRNASISGSFTYPSIGNIKVAQNSTTSSYINVPSYTVNMSVGATISLWFKFVNRSNWGGVFQLSGSSSQVTICRAQLYNNTNNFRVGTDGRTTDMGNVGGDATKWTNLVLTFGSGYITCYLDGQQVKQVGGGSVSGSRTANVWHQIGQGTYMYGATAQYSNYIIENKARTAQEVADYYNQTKSNYGQTPSAYQEVEWIQSSGNQYFRAGSSFKSSYKVVIDFQMDVIGGDYIPLGIQSSSSVKYGLNAYASHFDVVSGGSSWSNTISEDKNRHTITINKNTVTADGTNYTSNYVDYTFSQGIGVFCYNQYFQAKQYSYISSNKLYKLDIYDENGIQIFNGVPCYRKSDSVIGMFDTVNKVFYTNEGTGTFTKGPDVN